MISQQIRDTVKTIKTGFDEYNWLFFTLAGGTVLANSIGVTGLAAIPVTLTLFYYAGHVRNYIHAKGRHNDGREQRET